MRLLSDRNYLKAFADALFLSKCLLCDREFPSRICESCLLTLPYHTGPHCLKCGKPRKTDEPRADCGFCYKRDFRFRRSRSLIRYDTNCRKLLHNFKYDGDISLGHQLSSTTEKMLLDIPQGLSAIFESPVSFDFALFVPSGRAKRRILGSSPSRIIFERTVRRLGIGSPCRIRPATGFLTRKRDTPRQTELPFDRRIENAKTLFSLTKNTGLKGKTILLCDDLFTSGATLNECARLLRRGGAKEVYALTLFITEIDSPVI